MDLIDILLSVRQGTQQFACHGREINDFAQFQALVMQIEEAERLGLLDIVDLRRESYTGHRFISAISVSPLTQAGDAWIADADERG